MRDDEAKNQNSIICRCMCHSFIYVGVWNWSKLLYWINLQWLTAHMIPVTMVSIASTSTRFESLIGTIFRFFHFRNNARKIQLCAHAADILSHQTRTRTHTDDASFIAFAARYPSHHIRFMYYSLRLQMRTVQNSWCILQRAKVNSICIQKPFVLLPLPLCLNKWNLNWNYNN